MTLPTVAILFADPRGVYANLEGVDLWDEARDARTYAGPHPVVAHPPCARWGSYWHGGPLVKERKRLGDDGGCFQAALCAVRRFGGVLEHPAFSRAWDWFRLPKPLQHGGWIMGLCGGWSCHVEQSAYGHEARKPTWLYAFGTDRPRLAWGRAEGDFVGIDSGGHWRGETRVRTLSRRARAATPVAFRDVLISIARSARRNNP